MDEYSAGLVATYPITYRRNADNSLVDPTSPSVLLTCPAGTSLPSGATTPAAWQQRAYILRERVTPTTPGSYEWECTTAGTAEATEPAWPATPTPGTTTVVDGSVVWTCRHANSSKTITPTRVSLGQYTWSWTVPTGAPIGVYSYIVFGTIDGVPCESDLQQFEVVSPGGNVSPTPGQLVDLADNALTTVERLKLELGIDQDDTSQDDHLRMLINVVSGAIEAELNRDLGLAEVTELLSGYGRQRLNLRRFPIVDVDTATIDGVEVDDYKILPGELGQLWRKNGWPLSASRYGDLTIDADPFTADLNVEITYTGGYVLPKDATGQNPRTLPWVIEGACLRLAIDMHNRGPGLSSEQSAGGYRYEIGLTMLRDETRKLARYKRWV